MINDNYYYQTSDIYEDKSGNKKLQINFQKDCEKQIDELLNEMNKLLSTLKEGINLVLFYEYFFSRKPILYKAKEELISKIKNVSKNYKNTLFFFQFFINWKKLPKKNIDDIINYNNFIFSNHPFVNWEVNYDCIIITKDKKNWIANEVFVIFTDEVILSHKKAVYYKELTSKKLFKMYN